MMLPEEIVLRKGYLERFTNRQENNGWERLYFILYSSSPRNEPRLDWYHSEETSLHTSGLRNGLFLEEISRVERVSHLPDIKRKHGTESKLLFGIFTYRNDEPHLIKCADEATLKDWVKQLERALTVTRKTRSAGPEKQLQSPEPEELYTLVETTPGTAVSHNVEVEETAAAVQQGLKGCYRLTFSRQHLSLLNLDDFSTVLSWHYSYVRRFGYSENTFSIEGGRRSNSGKGLFILKNCNGPKLFADVQEKIRLLKEEADCSQTMSEGSRAGGYLNSEDQASSVDHKTLTSRPALALPPLTQDRLQIMESNGHTLSDGTEPSSFPSHLTDIVNRLNPILSKCEGASAFVKPKPTCLRKPAKAANLSLNSMPFAESSGKCCTDKTNNSTPRERNQYTKNKAIIETSTLKSSTSTECISKDRKLSNQTLDGPSNKPKTRLVSAGKDLEISDGKGYLETAQQKIKNLPTPPGLQLPPRDAKESKEKPPPSSKKSGQSPKLPANPIKYGDDNKGMLKESLVHNDHNVNRENGPACPKISEVLTYLNQKDAECKSSQEKLTYDFQASKGASEYDLDLPYSRIELRSEGMQTIRGDNMENPYGIQLIALLNDQDDRFPDEVKTKGTKTKKNNK